MGISIAAGATSPLEAIFKAQPAIPFPRFRPTKASGPASGLNRQANLIKTTHTGQIVGVGGSDPDQRLKPLSVFAEPRYGDSTKVERLGLSTTVGDCPL